MRATLKIFFGGGGVSKEINHSPLPKFLEKIKEEGVIGWQRTIPRKGEGDLGYFFISC